MTESRRQVGHAGKRAALRVLGQRLRSMRVEAALTQNEVAAKVEVSTQTIRNWEAGRHEPGPAALDKLSEVLNKPIADIMADEQHTDTVGDPELHSEDGDGMDQAMDAYKLARPDLSEKAVSTIAEFITFVHQRELNRRADR